MQWKVKGLKVTSFLHNKFYICYLTQPLSSKIQGKLTDNKSMLEMYKGVKIFTRLYGLLT